MTQEEKNLLLKDLCARLPYGVICFAPDYEFGDIWKLWCIEPFEDLDPPITVQYPKGNTITKICSEVKPYLRPMSSMTEEEKDELLAIVRKESDIVCEQLKNNDCGIKEGKYHFNSALELEFLLSHHFDFRGLINKGLALEAPEGMYK